MSKGITHTLWQLPLCGRDPKKFNCEGSLDRPRKPQKGMHSLQTRGCINFSATNLQRLPDTCDLQEIPTCCQDSSHKQARTGRLQDLCCLLQACYVSSISLSCTTRISLEMREKIVMDVWSVALMLDVSIVARDEFTENANSKKNCACNSCLCIERN